MIDKANMGPAAGAPAPRQASALSRIEAEGKGNEFREALRQDAGKRGTPGRPEDGPGSEAGQKMRAGNEKADPALPPPFSGDALLRGLGGAYAPLETQAAASSALNASSDAPALAADLAERILVNADNRAAGGEVRITLKDSVLPDAEILLRREGERLVVQLVSGNPASLDALRLAQEDLRVKLLALDQDVSVEVLDNRNQENGDNSGHSGRRSHGLDYFSESER
jgi:type III secretion system needle length determinant